jgi:hypothetical protein
VLVVPVPVVLGLVASVFPVLALPLLAVSARAANDVQRCDGPAGLGRRQHHSIELKLGLSVSKTARVQSNFFSKSCSYQVYN